MLGSFELSDAEGHPVQSVLAQPKRAALLAYLALEMPRGYHRRDTLLAMFWPDADEMHARRALNQAIHHLRSGLGSELIHARGDDELGLDDTRYRCDVVAMRECLDTDHLEEALDLYRGDLLPGFHVEASNEFDEWLERERRALHDAAVEAAITLARRGEDGSDTTAALHWARRACALAPNDEACAQQLMRLLIHQGNVAAARSEFERLTARLKREFDAAPSAETVKLLERIEAGEQRRASPASPSVSPVLGESSDDHLPGRAAPGAIARLPLRLRRRFAAITVSAAVVAASAYAVVAGGSARPSLHLPLAPGANAKVLVADLTGPPNDSALGSVVSQLLVSGLQDSRAARVVSGGEVKDALGRMQRPKWTAVRGTIARELAVREGYGAVLDGSVRNVGGELLVTVSLTDPVSEHLLFTTAAAARNAEGLTIAVDRLVRLTRQRIGDSATAIARSRPLAQVTTPSLEALRAFTEATRHGTYGSQVRAIELLEKAITLDSGFASAYRSLGVLLYWDGQPERSSDMFRRALAHSDRLTDVDRDVTAGTMYSRGRYYDPDRAIAALDAVLARDSMNVIALQELAFVLQRVGKYERAEQLNDRAVLASDSATGMVFFALAYPRFHLGKIESGWAALNEGIRREPIPQLFLLRARAHVVLGQYDSAEADFRRALDIAQASERSAFGLTVNYRRATIARIHGRLAEAGRLDAERLDSARVRHNLSDQFSARFMDVREALWLRNDRAAALRYLEPLRRFADSIPGMNRPDPALAVGYALAGRPDVATVFLRREENKYAPGEWRDRRLGLHILRAYIALGQDRAAEAVRELRFFGPGCYECVPQLMIAFERAGMPDSAIAVGEAQLATTDLYREGPEGFVVSVVHRRLGYLYAQRGDARRAEQHLAAFVALWADADPELRPQVDSARKVIAQLRSRSAPRF